MLFPGTLPFSMKFPLGVIDKSFIFPNRPPTYVDICCCYQLVINSTKLIKSIRSSLNKSSIYLGTRTEDVCTTIILDNDNDMRDYMSVHTVEDWIMDDLEDPTLYSPVPGKKVSIDDKECDIGKGMNYLVTNNTLLFYPHNH